MCDFNVKSRQIGKSNNSLLNQTIIAFSKHDRMQISALHSLRKFALLGQIDNLGHGLCH